MIYLDTCALVKLVHPEPETDALRAFLKERVRVPKFTSTITLAELLRAVRRANHDQAGRAAALLDAELAQARQLLGTLRMVETTRAVLADAAESPGPFLRTLDAIHLTAAVRFRLGLSAFVTYDKRLAAAAAEAGLPVAAPS